MSQICHYWACNEPECTCHQEMRRRGDERGEERKVSVIFSLSSFGDGRRCELGRGAGHPIQLIQDSTISILVYNKWIIEETLDYNYYLNGKSGQKD